MPSNVWKSDRLVYRGIEKSDEEFFKRIISDGDTRMDAVAFLPTPPNSKVAIEWRDTFDNPDMALAALACLPPPPPPPPQQHNDPTPAHANGDSDSSAAPPTPPRAIGFIGLRAPIALKVQSRNYTLVTFVAPESQNQGYGTEMVRWALEWAFRRAAVHRVSLQAYAFNSRALHVYEKVGFKREGVLREANWHDGRFWDECHLGILEQDWWEMQKGNVETAVS